MATIASLEPVVVNVSPKTNWTFVAVTLADGATGWGECSLNGWEPLLVAQARMLAADARGRDVADVGDLVRYLPHSPGGLVAHAVKSAAEQALADLRARAAGKPVAHLLAGAPRGAVPAYANINRSVTDRTPQGFADAARRAVAAGYRAVKLAPFDGVIAEDAAHTPIDARTRAGLDRVFAVRDAVGADVAVMVDCHWRFDVDRAEALLRDIAPAKPYWVECMISEHPLGFGSIARLTALAHERGIRTAGGETIAGADAAQAMCAGKLYDVLMPDIKYAGGYAGMLRDRGRLRAAWRRLRAAQSDRADCARREHPPVRRRADAALARASMERDAAVRGAGGRRRAAARGWRVRRCPRRRGWASRLMRHWRARIPIARWARMRISIRAWDESSRAGRPSPQPSPAAREREGLRMATRESGAARR